MGGEYMSSGTAITHDAVLMPSLSVSGTKNSTWQTVTSASAHVATDLSKGDCIYHVLTENTTIDNPTNPVDGQMVRYLFLNAVGNYTVAWGAKFKPTGGAAPTITVGAKNSMVEWIYNGTLDLYFEKARSLNM